MLGNECLFYSEFRYVLEFLSWLQTGLSDSRPLSHEALHRMLVGRGCVHDDLIGELGVTKEKGRLLWP